MIQKPKSLYLKVVRITDHYLGPAADRFIRRQIENHLNKHPEELAQADLKELISWIEVSMAVLTADRKIIREYLAKLQSLISSKH
ncbi:MAG TPA: hypothetical protein VMQ52_04595 [Candidatus Saccharimonadales bacterium]|nr:hypothetical protein [Candidatus Saccharimonadales bacterium]